MESLEWGRESGNVDRPVKPKHGARMGDLSLHGVDSGHGGCRQNREDPPPPRAAVAYTTTVLSEEVDE